MPATDQTVTSWMGDTHIIAIPVKDGDNNNVDLTGASADWWMGKNANAKGADVYIKKSSAVPTEIQLTNNLGLWTVTIKILPADTETLKPGKWYHECRVTDSAGNMARVSLGSFVLNPSIILP
jgi:hypothetical protein